MRSISRYLNRAETCYKSCNLLFVRNVLLLRKIGGIPFAKSKIQRTSPNIVHCMHLIFEPIVLRWKFWGIPLRRNVSRRRFSDVFINIFGYFCPNFYQFCDNLFKLGMVVESNLSLEIEEDFGIVRFQLFG